MPGEQLRFDIIDADLNAAKQHHIEVLRKAGVYRKLRDDIGGVIGNRLPGYKYVWGNAKSSTDIERLFSKGYEIVYTHLLERKCKCTAKNGGEPLSVCVACKGTGKEKYTDPKAEQTRHRNEDGTHCWGDIILTRVKQDVYDAWKKMAEIQSLEAVRSSRERTLGRFREENVEASLETDDSSKT